jgi:hypothetical protein
VSSAGATIDHVLLLAVLQQQVEEQRMQKATRLTLQKGDHLSVEEAREKIEQKTKLAMGKASQKAAQDFEKLQNVPAHNLQKVNVCITQSRETQKKRVAMLTKLEQTFLMKLRSQYLTLQFSMCSPFW